MTATNTNGMSLGRTLIATTVAGILLAACAAAPMKPDGAADSRAKLTQLQSNPDLASRAPVAIKEAEAAVRTAEQPQTDKELALHNVYMANTKVDIARAQAETRFAEDQRPALSEQRETARLDSRTREADVAKDRVATARAETDAAKNQVATARAETDAANAAAASSAEQSAELQRQIDGLQAKVTARGWEMTLGDTLFTSGRADLKAGASGNLDKLITFLNAYPNRTATIEGYTDNVGTDDYNLGLSQRRADSVKSYLTRQGIEPVRLTSAGKGESEPVVGNDTAAGRQQNRRVAIIINNLPIASR
jgi:outer membrane protein OmpA-like peptidoglycan-associated protein